MLVCLEDACQSYDMLQVTAVQHGRETTQLTTWKKASELMRAVDAGSGSSREADCCSGSWLAL